MYTVYFTRAGAPLDTDPNPYALESFRATYIAVELNHAPMVNGRILRGKKALAAIFASMQTENMQPVTLASWLAHSQKFAFDHTSLAAGDIIFDEYAGVYWLIVPDASGIGVDYVRLPEKV